MGVWAPSQGLRIGDDDGATYETSVNPSASANTKGSWVTLIASTAFPVQGMIVTIHSGSVNNDYLVDIGIGSAGNEQVIVANLLDGDYEIGMAQYRLPLYLPAGVRISARSQSSGASTLLKIKLQVLGGGPRARNYTRTQTWGAATADSGGTSIDPGGVANTKGAWVQLVASSAFRVQALICGVGGAVNLGRSDTTIAFDLGVGAAGSEQVVMPNLLLWGDANADHVIPSVQGPFAMDIPAGTRVACRSKSNITNASNRLFDLVAYGLG